MKRLCLSDLVGVAWLLSLQPPPAAPCLHQRACWCGRRRRLLQPALLLVLQRVRLPPLPPQLVPVLLPGAGR